MHAVHKAKGMSEDERAPIAVARQWHKEVHDMVGGALPEFPLLQGENEGVDPMAEPEKEEISDVLQHNVKDETLVEYGFKENEFIMAKDSKVPNPTVWQIVTIDMDRQMVTMQQANSIQELERRLHWGVCFAGSR